MPNLSDVSTSTVDRRPIVVAAPRSGFSLLIHILSTIRSRHGGPSPPDRRHRIMRRLIDLAGEELTRRFLEVFADFGLSSDLVYNGEFHLLVGGPKWLSPDRPERACFRKYFGIRGLGDFLLVTSHPRELMDYYSVIHSHTAPPLWLKQPDYDDCVKLTSIRNPIGIVNSASFSLNAMASEHVQRFLPGVSEDFLRQRLALYKLTDLEFVCGLVKFLKNYLDEYLPVRDGYRVMRWEDLITEPVRTIRQVGGYLGYDLTDEEAAEIWKPMDHVNLLQHHKHNYRHGKGIVGDWKNSLVNEHLEIFRELGFDRYLKELGYPPIPTLDPRDYSPFQRLVAAHLARGQIYRSTGDQDLFNFAFNKSNIDVSRFNFKSYPKREWTHLERSCLANDAIPEAVSDVAEGFCEEINRMFGEVVNADLHTVDQAERLITNLERQGRTVFATSSDRRREYVHGWQRLRYECA